MYHLFQLLFNLHSKMHSSSWICCLTIHCTFNLEPFIFVGYSRLLFPLNLSFKVIVSAWYSTAYVEITVTSCYPVMRLVGEIFYWLITLLSVVGFPSHQPTASSLHPSSFNNTIYHRATSITAWWLSQIYTITEFRTFVGSLRLCYGSELKIAQI